MSDLYKVLGENGEPHHGGTGRWALPRGKRPGKWMPAVPVDPCMSGYHVCSLEHLLSWLGPRIWHVEIRGEVVDHGDKLVAAEARLIAPTGWSETTSRLFAADCAERVLHVFEAACPGDGRPRRAVDAARAYARGEIDGAARAAAGAAAWDARAAAGAAAWDAAWDAERAWQAGRLLTYLDGTG